MESAALSWFGHSLTHILFLTSPSIKQMSTFVSLIPVYLWYNYVSTKNICYVPQVYEVRYFRAVNGNKYLFTANKSLFIHQIEKVLSSPSVPCVADNW